MIMFFALSWWEVLIVFLVDPEAPYAYKRGDIVRCIQLSETSETEYQSMIIMYPEFIQLMDNDIASLSGSAGARKIVLGAKL